MTELPNQTMRNLPLEKLRKIAKGPYRPENPNAELGEALLAIRILADHAKICPKAAKELLLVIQETDWLPTIEMALEELLKVADVDQLQRLARYFFNLYYSPGEYGGGLVAPRRLKKVADRLEELGTPIYACFPESQYRDLDYLIKKLASPAFVS